MRDNTLAIKQPRQTRTNISATFFYISNEEYASSPPSCGLYVEISTLFTPRTKSRALGLLSALMSHPPFSRERTIHEQIHGLDRIADEYRRS